MKQVSFNKKDEVPITSSSALDAEIRKISILAKQKESDETWKQFDDALTLLRDNIKTIHLMDSFSSGIKKISAFIGNCVLSERSRLCGTACDLLVVTSEHMKQGFEIYIESFIPPLLKLCLRANKVFNTRGTFTLEALIKNAGMPKVADYLVDAIRSPNKSYRVSIAGLVASLLVSNDTDDLKVHLNEIEFVIRQGLTDADAGVREKSRAAFVQYKLLFPMECASIPSSALKYIETSKPVRTEEPQVAKPMMTPVKQVSRNEDVDVKPIIRASTKTATTARVMASVLGSTNILEKLKNPSSNTEKPKSNVAPTDHVSRAALVGSVLAEASLVSKEKPTKQPVKPEIPEPVATPRRQRLLLGPSKRILPSEDTNDPLSNNAAKVLSPTYNLKVQSAIHANQSDALETLKSPIREPEKPVVERQKPAAPRGMSRISYKHAAHEKTQDSVLEKVETSIETKSTFDFNSSLLNTKSHDWNVRMLAYQSFYDNATTLLEGNSAEKLMSILVSGLDDSHFRVLRVVLDCWQDLLHNHSPAKYSKHFEAIIPKLLAVSESPQNKNRSGIKESATMSITTIKEIMNKNEFTVQMFNVLNLPEYAANVRVRHGAICLILEEIPKISREFFSKVAVFRMALSRLSASMIEADKIVLKQIAYIMLVMHSVSSDMFFEAITYLSAGDKMKIRGLVGKDIADYRKLEEYAANARNSQKYRSGDGASGTSRGSKLPVKANITRTPSISKKEPVAKLEKTPVKSDSLVALSDSNETLEEETTTTASLNPTKADGADHDIATLGSSKEPEEEVVVTSAITPVKPITTDAVDRDCSKSDVSFDDFKETIALTPLNVEEFVADPPIDAKETTPVKRGSLYTTPIKTSVDHRVFSPMDVDSPLPIVVPQVHEDTPTKAQALRASSPQYSTEPIISKPEQLLDMLSLDSGMNTENSYELVEKDETLFERLLEEGDEIESFGSSSTIDFVSEASSPQKGADFESTIEANAADFDKDENHVKVSETITEEPFAEGKAIVSAFMEDLLENVELRLKIDKVLEDNLPMVWDFIDSCISRAVEISEESRLQVSIPSDIKSAPKTTKMNVLRQVQQVLEHSLPTNYAEVLSTLIQTITDKEAEVALLSRQLVVSLGSAFHKSNPETYDTEFLRIISKNILKQGSNAQMLGFMLSAKFQAAKLPFFINLQEIIEAKGFVDNEEPDSFCIVKIYDEATPSIPGSPNMSTNSFKTRRESKTSTDKLEASANSQNLSVSLSRSIVRQAGAEVQQEKTKTVWKSKQPYFDGEFDFELSETFKEISVELMVKNLLKDKCVGIITIPRYALELDGRSHEEWYTVRSTASVDIDEKTKAHELASHKLTVPQNCSKCHSLVFLTSAMKCTQCHAIYCVKCSQNPPQNCGIRGLVRIRYIYTEEFLMPITYYSKLSDLILNDGFYTLQLLGRVTDDREDLAKTLVILTEFNGIGVKFLDTVASAEILGTADPNTIFRANSLGSKAVDQFMKLHGMKYLKTVLYPVIKEITAQNRICEIDKSRLEKGDDPEECITVLQAYLSWTIDMILNSAKECPAPMRQVFGNLRKAAMQAFPKDSVVKYTVVTAFIFLRFFNAAILGPQLFGLSPDGDPPNARNSRTFTLMSKTIQQLSNATPFDGKKEPYMEVLNPLIFNNMDRMKKFVDDLCSTVSESEVTSYYRRKSSSSGNKGMSKILRLFKKDKENEEDKELTAQRHFGAVHRNLMKYQDKMDQNTREHEKQELKQLNGILAEMLDTYTKQTSEIREKRDLDLQKLDKLSLE